MNIALGADHRGFALKEDLQMYLEAQGHTVNDVGARHLDPTDDYPDYAYAAAMLVASGEADRAILICGSGAGMVIAANKVAGIRAVEAQTVPHIIAARKDDDANVLALGADEVDEDLAREIADAFLSAPYEKEERHERRLDEISEIEKNDGREREYE